MKYATDAERQDAIREQRRQAQARYRVTERGKATALRYWQSPKGQATGDRNKQQNGQKWVERTAERQRERQQERPAQAKAQRRLNYAVRMGRIIRASACQSCHVQVRLHGHHHRGYTGGAELDVVWLCPACHKAAHRKGVV